MTDDLKTLPILVVDCQTTGNSSARSHILELGFWAVTAQDHGTQGREKAVSFVLKLPEGVSIPLAVKKLTGISDGDVTGGVDPARAWRALAAKARETALSGGLERCAVIIHYARFERPFLEQLHQQFTSAQPFPLEIVCTHEIARRLLPSLPRKGLRAVAGYLGHSVGALKRCSDHLAATAFVWRHLVQRLAADEQVVTLAQLTAWLEQAPAAAGTEKVYPMPREKRLSLPDTPGIYRFMRSNGDVLYIGKARSLKQRVNSYFRRGTRHAEKNLEMLTQAFDFEVQETATALEAALLESAAIKAHNPPYNVALVSGDRKLFFFSKDFSGYADMPDGRCSIGPVLVPESFEVVRRVAACLDQAELPVEELQPVQWLLLPERYCPEEDCLRKGLVLFIGKYAAFKGLPSVWHLVLRLGRYLWKEKLERQEAIDEQDDGDLVSEEEPEEKTGDFVWTPEQVVHTLEAHFRRCGHLLRRASWFTLLSESTIGWQDRNGDLDRTHAVVFSRGKIAQRFFLSEDDAIPVPPGNDLPLLDRKAHLDLQAYDGLRVLTTECRRLVSGKRRVQIRLNRSAPLQGKALERLLQWV